MATTFYPKEVVDEVFAAGGNFRTAAVLNPRLAKVRSADGGVVIEDGLWAFNSGVEHAGWVVLGIPVLDDAGNVVDRGAALIRLRKLNWSMTGTRSACAAAAEPASGSRMSSSRRSGSLSLAEPAGKTTRRRTWLVNRYIGSRMLHFLQSIWPCRANLALPGLGMAKAALDLFLQKSTKRAIAFTDYTSQADAAATHLLIGEASSKIDAAELILKRSLEELETTALSEKMSMQHRTRMWRDAGFASRLVWQAVDLLAGASEGSFARSSDRMNRIATRRTISC
ncbi:hypothetical protein [Candidatus Phyllobacterium onerii]|uniref:hypothetical protein n=1 Tax=Candidatus Phyllobacterium onerii TaxID=3020828 RepID=UPI00232B6121|nr:hypothetical protein [Phyllobacterium sp. IY22]